MEFCYFANLMQLVFVNFLPDNQFVWFMVWCSDSGVVALGAILL